MQILYTNYMYVCTLFLIDLDKFEECLEGCESSNLQTLKIGDMAAEFAISVFLLVSKMPFLTEIEYIGKKVAATEYEKGIKEVLYIALSSSCACFTLYLYQCKCCEML